MIDGCLGGVRIAAQKILRQQANPVGDGYGDQPVVTAEFAVNVFEMLIYRAWTDTESMADGVSWQPIVQDVQHGEFAGGEGRNISGAVGHLIPTIYSVVQWPECGQHGSDGGGRVDVGVIEVGARRGR